MVHALWPSPQEHLRAQSRILRIPGTDLDVSAHVARNQKFVVRLDCLARSAHPRECQVPVFSREAHRLPAVLQTEVEQRFAMTFVQPGLNVLREGCDVLFGGIEQQRFETHVGDIVRETEVVEDAELVMLFNDGGGLARWPAQRLLLLDVVRELAEGLYWSASWSVSFRD
jgi:hypothetical protein